MTNQRSLANLKPVQPGQILNPAGRNQYSQRGAFLENVEKTITEQDRRELLAVLVTAGKNGEPWAMKILTDRLWPAPTRVELDAIVGRADTECAKCASSEGAWETLSAEMDRIEKRREMNAENMPPALKELQDTLNRIRDVQPWKLTVEEAIEALKILHQAGGLGDVLGIDVDASLENPTP